MKSFLTDEDGAITVDWVVITAAIIGLQVILMVNLIRDSMLNVSSGISNTVDEYGQYIE